MRMSEDRVEPDIETWRESDDVEGSVTLLVKNPQIGWVEPALAFEDKDDAKAAKRQMVQPDAARLLHDVPLIPAGAEPGTEGGGDD